MSEESCPVCGGEPVFLGVLGRRQQFRCRACGWTFAWTEEPCEHGHLGCSLSGFEGGACADENRDEADRIDGYDRDDLGESPDF